MLAGFDPLLLAEVGFESDEIDGIFDDDKEDDFDLEEELVNVVNPVSKYGEIYQLGKHRLMCGDATKDEDLNRLMAGSKAQMCFTDPPYNVNYTGGMGTHDKNERDGIMNDKMSKEDFYQFLLAVCKNIIKVTGGDLCVYVLNRVGHA